jgi:hypothetical protein
MMMERGDTVYVAYFGYYVRATIVEPENRYGWCVVRQDSDFEDLPEDERPEYQALACYITRPDEPLADPLAGFVNMLRGKRRDGK